MAEDNLTPPDGTTSVEYVLDSYKAEMKNDVPEVPNVKIPQSETPPEGIITDANTTALDPLVVAQGKIVDQYIKFEETRLTLQKPLQTNVIELTKLLIWLFNIVIGAITFAVLIFCFVQAAYSTQILDMYFEFLRYYIGAVLLELLGLLAFIIKSVFASNYSKVIDSIFKPKS
jgi:hypothetical protein